ncbi:MULTISPECIES: RDD family protein [Streptomyces]|uniref:RDD family protein n=1 Tax=Streptomyces TaxID=1883 RepID=UPI0004AB5991|nr:MULTISPECIES: RDD family protein [Streptomyces]
MSYAPWWRRTAAFFIDFALMWVYFGIGYLLKQIFADGDWGDRLLFLFIGLGLWSNFYNKCVRMGKEGHTWGKQLMGFKLLHEPTNAPMGPLRAFVRENAHMTNICTLGVGFLRPFWDAKGQTFADTVMKTVAVNTAKSSENASAQPRQRVAA